MFEKWKEIPGYEGLYQASTIGMIRSLGRISSTGKLTTGRVLSQSKDTNGYLKVNLSKDKKAKCFNSHRLVMMAFRGNSRLHVDHLNRNKADNRLENLEYVTMTENVCRGSSSDLKKGKASVYRHVNVDKKNNKWVIRFMINGKKRYLGRYDNEFDAFLHVLLFKIVNDYVG